MKKGLQTSKKSLESLKGKKLGDLRSVYAGQQNEAIQAPEMGNCITIMEKGGTADDSSWDR